MSKPIHNFSVETSLHRHAIVNGVSVCKSAFVGVHNDGSSRLSGDLLGDMTVDELEAMGPMISSCVRQYAFLVATNRLLADAALGEPNTIIPKFGIDAVVEAARKNMPAAIQGE